MNFVGLLTYSKSNFLAEGDFVAKMKTPTESQSFENISGDAYRLIVQFNSKRHI